MPRLVAHEGWPALGGILVRSIITAFEKTVDQRGDAIAARYRDENSDWQTVTWRQLDIMRRELATGLLELGLAAGESVNILSRTSLRWVITDLAIVSAGGEAVPVYEAGLPSECTLVVRDSGGRFVFVQDQEQLDKLLCERTNLREVRKVIVLEGPVDASDWTMSWDELVSIGRAKLEELSDELRARSAMLTEASHLTIIYTSGTTGRPKGVVLTHGNFLSISEACIRVQQITPNDVQLLFLPLAQVFARLIECVWFVSGHEMAIDSNTQRIGENLKQIRPTVMASVPRIMEKIYARFINFGLEDRDTQIEAYLFKWALSLHDSYAQLKIEGRRIPIQMQVQMAAARRLVFSTIAGRLEAFFGGRLRYIISGGAPLPKKMAIFFETTGVNILEGYGLTETSGAATVNRPGLYKMGTVGTPLPGTEIKIAEDGEILIRGPGVMPEYWARPKSTASAFLPGGWLASGDVGSLDRDGNLTITARKKDIIVTAGGRNIAPQKIETAIRSSSSLISHVLVHGDRRKFLSALIALDPEEVRKFGLQHSLGSGYAAICRSPEARVVVQGVIDGVNRQLAIHESIRAFKILERDFRVGEELTATFKLRRQFCTDKYAPILNAFYDHRFS